jgi:hypothetical protein
MRMVQIRDGALEIRWTWLPYWLAVNPRLKTELERELHDAVLLCGVTTSEPDLDAMHEWVITRLQALFPAFQGLRAYLDGISQLREPSRAA